MKPLAIVAALAAGTVVVPAAQKGKSERSAYVTLDAVVLDDRSGHPVRGLQSGDFEVKEDGKAVTIDHTSEVALLGLADERVGRSIVLLLDDTLRGASSNTVVQGLSRMFLSQARPDDAVGVVRLTHKSDDAVGSLEQAVERVDQYRARALPFFGIESIEDLLNTVTRISKAVASNPPRRTAAVCIGQRVLCDPYFPNPEYSLASRQWNSALVQSARANVAVYFVDPAGVTGAGPDMGYGLVDHTGGVAFTMSNSFQRAVDSIWEQAGHYYLLGYTPTSDRRDQHTIEVKVKHSDMTVHARLARGD